MIIFAISMVVMIVTLFTGSSFMSTGLWVLIVGISTLLFLFYMIFDISMISKTQQFINTEDKQLTWTIGMIFGFRLLVDLVGLVWNIAMLVLRFAR
jgi:hypothetical protein